MEFVTGQRGRRTVSRPPYGFPSGKGAPAGGGAGGATISLSLSFSPNRTSGVAPLAVFFDATDTSSVQTTRPFHDIYYKWDFGDPAGGATYSYGSKSSIDKNTAYGPCAGHVFQSAGDYTVTLTAFDGVTKTTSTALISVSDPATAFTQRHFYSNDTTYAVGTPAHNGTTVFRHDSTTDFDLSIATDIGTNRALYFEWGDTFTASEGYEVIVDGPGTIGANPYGSGVRPIVSGDFGLSLSTNTNHDFADWRFIDLDFQGSADTATGVFALGGANNVTFLRCKWTNFLIGCNLSISTLDTINSGGFVVDVWTGWCFSECEWSGQGENNLLAPFKKLMLLGNSFGPVAAEHPVRTAYLQGAAIQANTIDGTGGAGVPITIRAIPFAGTATTGANAWTEKIVVSDNKILGSTGPYIMATQRPNDTADSNYSWRNIVIERNWLVQTAAGNQRFYYCEGNEITFRNNLCFATIPSTGALGMVQFNRNTTANPTAFDRIDVYNNTFYSGQTVASTCAQADINGAIAPTNVSILNNVAYLPNYSTFLFTSGTFGTGGNRDTTKNSTGGAGGQMDATNPGPAWAAAANPDTRVQNDFVIDTGSYAIGAGQDGIKVFDDFFNAIRDWSTPDTDMGFDAFTLGSLP